MEQLNLLPSAPNSSLIGIHLRDDKRLAARYVPSASNQLLHTMLHEVTAALNEPNARNLTVFCAYALTYGTYVPYPELGDEARTQIAEATLREDCEGATGASSAIFVTAVSAILPILHHRSPDRNFRLTGLSLLYDTYKSIGAAVLNCKLAETMIRHKSQERHVPESLGDFHPVPGGWATPWNNPVLYVS